MKKHCPTCRCGALPSTEDTYRGPDLRAERVRRRLRGVDIATRMDLSHQRVYQIEQMWRVSEDLVKRYLKALDA